MSSETYTYKGISAGKYIEGNIEAINEEEASFKLKEQKIIITNLVKTKLILTWPFSSSKPWILALVSSGNSSLNKFSA